MRPLRRPAVMGILNVTPDSFSDGGRYVSAANAVHRALQLVEAGADVIDIGGESTRPGSAPVSLREELRRVIPVIRQLRRRTRVPISIDTSKAEVARQALAAGASIVNDITALRGDPAMADVVSRARVPVILMHMRGTPRTMQRAPRYRDVVAEVSAWLRDAVRRARAAGIARSRIWIDPGLGFGKTARHNLLLMRHLKALKRLGQPIVLGPSRKSFIGRATGAPVAERLPGTLTCLAQAAIHGIDMVRVHDVAETVQFLTMWSAIAHAA